MTTSAPRIFFTARDQVFRLSISSLKPSTTHNLFFERVRVLAANIKPLGGSLGDPIVTDLDGKVVFDYFYNSGITSNATEVDQAQKIANTIAGRKEIVIADLNEVSLIDGFEKTTLSYFRTMINVSVFVVPESQYIKNVVTVPAAARITPTPPQNLGTYWFDGDSNHGYYIQSDSSGLGAW